MGGQLRGGQQRSSLPFTTTMVICLELQGQNYAEFILVVSTPVKSGQHLGV